MDTLFILMYIFLVRFFLFLIDKKFSKNIVRIYSLIGFLISCAFAVPLPMALINKGIITETAINVILAGVSIFYFAFVISKVLGNIKGR